MLALSDPSSFALRWLKCHLKLPKLHTGRCKSKFHVGVGGVGGVRLNDIGLVLYSLDALRPFIILHYNQ